MLKPCPSRWFYLSQFLATTAILALAYGLEYFQGLIPCALCEVQRLCFGLLAFLFLLASILPLKKAPQVLVNLLLVSMSLFGALFAGRQVFLQYLPASFDFGTCEASLQYMLDIMPWYEVLRNVFLGGPECAKINGSFLHLSFAAWALFLFIVFFLLAFRQGLGWLVQDDK